MGWLSLLPAGAVRALRGFLLKQGRRMGGAAMLARSQSSALRACMQAARHSPAYRALLQESGIAPSGIGPQTDLASLPVLTKTNTFERFPLAQLARPLPAAALADVLTSSGRGGRSYGFRLTAREQYEDAWFDIDLGLQDIFGVDDKPTLLVNCLPMGVVFHSRAVAVANVSVREDMACSILRDVGPGFAQTLLCTDPMFIRRLLDEGQRVGVDWRALGTSAILGEEVLVEAQRDYIAARMGIDIDNDPHRVVGSSFGVGELGLNLLFETRETIRMRRAMRSNAEVAQLLCATTALDAMPSVFCYNPLRSHLEVLNPDANGFGELCITMLGSGSVIPLPRYATGDMARLVPLHHAQQAATLAGVQPPWLPLVLVQGRIKDRPAGMPSVESIKELIYLDHTIADQLSGAFRLEHAGNGQTRLTLQANHAQLPSPALQQGLLQLCARHGLGGMEMCVLGLEEFPWRPALDYERKFDYVAPHLR
ncbi:MAG: hypothetical protein JSR53_12140 [Proteobacteria bacterium]|nr:hypothetical protein [Pseudomonadota bacterium]